MKYSSSNSPLVCMQTQSTCYNGTRTMTPCGILWHSTGVKNTSLKRYVQPSDTKPAADTYDKAKWLQVLGKNTNGNDWNHKKRQAGLNCWIGKLADGTVTTVQTMPWNFRPWGCGSGKRGSCNSGWIQFEICEDGLTDRSYFNEVYTEACEITAYLCKLYNINPNGVVTKSGVKIPTIICHQDSYRLGFGSNHGDVYHWFKRHGKTMDSVRQDVATLLKGGTVVSYNQPEDADTETSTKDEAFSAAISNILIRKFSAVSASETGAEIEINTNRNFNDYSWSYRLTIMNTAKQLPDQKLAMTETKTILKLSNLTPNTAYSLELLAEDRFKNIVKSPSIIFNTLQSSRNQVKNLIFDYSTGELSFEAPINSTNNQYRVSVIINGCEYVYSDKVLKNSSGGKITESIMDLLSKVTIKEGDFIQIGVAPVVKDSESILMSYSTPIYIRTTLQPVSNVFLRVKDNYTKAIIFFNK